MSRQYCRVCGRPVKQNKRGRPKEAHKVCIALESRVSQVDDLCSQIKFQNKKKLKRLRGDLFCIVNGPLHPYNAQFAPDDDEDAEIKTRDDLSNCVQEKGEDTCAVNSLESEVTHAD